MKKNKYIEAVKRSYKEENSYIPGFRMIKMLLKRHLKNNNFPIEEEKELCDFHEWFYKSIVASLSDKNAKKAREELFLVYPGLLDLMRPLPPGIDLAKDILYRKAQEKRINAAKSLSKEEQEQARRLSDYILEGVPCSISTYMDGNYVSRFILPPLYKKKDMRMEATDEDKAEVYEWVAYALDNEQPICAIVNIDGDSPTTTVFRFKDNKPVAMEIDEMSDEKSLFNRLLKETCGLLKMIKGLSQGQLFLDSGVYDSSVLNKKKSRPSFICEDKTAARNSEGIKKPIFSIED